MTVVLEHLYPAVRILSLGAYRVCQRVCVLSSFTQTAPLGTEVLKAFESLKVSVF